MGRQIGSDFYDLRAVIRAVGPGEQNPTGVPRSSPEFPGVGPKGVPEPRTFLWNLRYWSLERSKNCFFDVFLFFFNGNHDFVVFLQNEHFGPGEPHALFSPNSSSRHPEPFDVFYVLFITLLHLNGMFLGLKAYLAPEDNHD